MRDCLAEIVGLCLGHAPFSPRIRTRKPPGQNLVRCSRIALPPHGCHCADNSTPSIKARTVARNAHDARDSFAPKNRGIQRLPHIAGTGHRALSIGGQRLRVRLTDVMKHVARERMMLSKPVRASRQIDGMSMSAEFNRDTGRLRILDGGTVIAEWSRLIHGSRSLPLPDTARGEHALTRKTLPW
ncbi:hypothetical protein AWB64_01606 [Caballeronia sordidicola]|uniref:Uncharacterized protein n=1 Tax=Caballeronia sordidicola TaxID=196367 RepID=A0A158FPE9_CABSO|nr:hypothetical protein AWB64_01606 [Caballeronia sordidicola]